MLDGDVVAEQHHVQSRVQRVYRFDEGKSAGDRDQCDVAADGGRGRLDQVWRGEVPLRRRSGPRRQRLVEHTVEGVRRHVVPGADGDDEVVRAHPNERLGIEPKILQECQVELGAHGDQCLVHALDVAERLTGLHEPHRVVVAAGVNRDAIGHGVGS